ncbi:MAG: OB-fold nucleic acid binding domain-containing protein [Ruminococcus sp.]
MIVNKIKNQITKSNQMMSFVTVEDKSGSIETIIFPKTLAEYGNYIYEGNIIEAVGTVNIRENEDPKVVVNQIRPAPPKDKIPTTVSKSKEEYKTNPVEKIGNRPVVKPDKLYLKIPDRKGEKYKKVKNLLEIFSGSTMVMFFVEEENKLYKAPRQLWADVNDVFISELKYILGKENVVFR